MKNNLFSYATSELSQDAFICYLLSFALEDAKDDPVLRECAMAFLREMVPELAGNSVVLTDVERQEHDIDVLLTAVCEGRKYKIIVEDKTYTKQHDNQLKKYLTYLSDKFPDCIPCGVYYKTGFQSDLSPVTEAGYHIITRSRMLELLAPYAARTSNQIILDYFEYWNDFEQQTRSWRTLPLSRWRWLQIYGFFDTLKNSNYPAERQVWMEYGYVPNQSGGFYGLWFGISDHFVTVLGVRCELYLQIEAAWKYGRYSFPICLKLKPLGEFSSGREIRNALIYDKTWNYRLSDYHFQKPHRLAVGTRMTVGIYDAAYETAGELTAAMSSAISDYIRLEADLHTG